MALERSETKLADTEIITLGNGPYVIKGAIKLVDASGAELPARDTVALCSCGHSGNKPFCDGTHRSVDFQHHPAG